MPLTSKGEKIKGAMEEQYGAKKGEEVFYASKNKGTITGVDGSKDEVAESALPCTCTLAEMNARNRQFWAGNETPVGDATPGELGILAAREDERARESHRTALAEAEERLSRLRAGGVNGGATFKKAEATVNFHREELRKLEGK